MDEDLSGASTKMAEKFADSLSEPQGRALVALLSSASVEAASRSAQLSPRTLWRWLREDDFKQAYRKARREQLGAATGRLAVAASGAVGALEEIAADVSAPASARVSAARALLEYGFRAHEQEDLERRIAELERTAAKIEEGAT